MNLHIRVLHNGLTTKMFSAECGSPLNSSRVATANLVLYPTIIPASCSITVPSDAGTDAVGGIWQKLPSCRFVTLEPFLW